jgi:exodeoxyribonuclease V beta subunit
VNRPEDHLLAGTIAREITLLEASAGTGKTYTISHRVLRLLLEESIDLQRILVVTFTRAATREVKARIRKVIVEARDALARSLAGAPVEDVPTVLVPILARSEDGRRRALSLTKKALDAMDLASIHTIHGFCERALSTNALELGYDTGAEPTASVESALRAVADDVYVERIVSASKEERQYLAQIGYTPSALRKVAKQAWMLRDAKVANEDAPTREAWLARVAAWIRSVRDRADDIAGYYAANDIRVSGREKAESIKRRVHECIAAASRELDDAPEVLLDGPSANISNLRPSHLAAKGWLHGCERVEHELLVELDHLVELGQAMRNQPFRELAADVPSLVERELERRGELGFDQIIEKIHDVVHRPEGAARLRRSLGARFDAALIDEFQDTDEAQWQIFRALFGEGKVFDLVGDPKQAIYGFRGADVHAYTAARGEAVAKSTMAVNRRSDAGYVDAMNVLFGLEGTPAEGLATTKTLGSNEIEYVGVRAWEKHRDPRLAGRAPLSLVRLTETVGTDRLADVVAESIVELLNGDARIRDDVNAPFRRVRPGDVAVLTRAGWIGRKVADALRARGVPCVTSKSANVWGSEAATLLDALLTAALHPHDRRALHVVAADRLFDLPASEIHRDEGGRLSHVASLVREVSRLLEEQGVAPAVVSVLAAPHPHGDGTVAAHVLSFQQGERLVTDLRHLGELLHLEAVSENLGELELLQRLQERRAAAGSADEQEQEHQQRLETDADSVKITTIHSSKGLEYPIVLLPDLDTIRLPGASDLTLDYHDAEGRRCLDVGKFRDKESAALARAALETRQEYMRLLYVAFTRARCHTTAFFYLPREKWPQHGGRQGRFACSPLATTLFGEDEGEARLASAERRVRAAKDAPALAALAESVEALVERSKGTIALHEAEKPSGARHAPPERETSLHEGLAYGGPERLEYGYSDYSYSRIVNSMEHALEERGGMDEGETEAPDASGGEGEIVPLALLEMGASIGTFAHAVFEHLDFTTCAPKPGRAHTPFELALDHAQREGLESASQCAELFSGALPGILSTPLGGELGEISLSRIPIRDRLDEVDFHLAVDADGRRWAKVRDVAAALGRSTEGLEDKSVRGFVMGSIDLVFRVNGASGTRYFVADYKSNFLGPRLDDYLPARLARAMEEHRYWLQAAFYLVALDRFLEERLGAAYDYETHCGGALYLFFRGMVGERSRLDAERTRGVHLIRPSADEMRALRAALSGGTP